MSTPERGLALSGLLSLFYDDEFSDKIVDISCNKLKTDKQKAFFTKLFMGTVENAIFLDEIIKFSSKRKIKDINRVILNILRLSAYQIVFLNSVPVSAAISEALSLCSERKNERAKGFVSGVLHNIERNKERIERDIYLGKSESEKIAVKYSCPLWLVSYLEETLGSVKVDKLLKSFFENHYLTLRINTNKTKVNDFKEALDKSEIEWESIPETDSVRLVNNVPVTSVPGYKEGHFYVMDASSQKAVLSADISSGEYIMDLCSAPGGKGLYAAQLAGDDGFASLRDISKTKTDIIKENKERLNIKNVEIKEWDATVTDREYIGKADLVICDCPCSGIGTIGDKPEIKYKINKSQIENLSKIQAKILDTAVSYVKQGGRILFSTCTIGRVENEDNTKRFLKDHPDFDLKKEELILPGALGGQGFYYAVLKNHAG